MKWSNGPSSMKTATRTRATPRLSGYSASKQQAEHTFAEAAEQSGMWDSITCCPADNVGPIQSAHIRATEDPGKGLMKRMLLGECNPAVHGYRPWHTVDVRDTAAVQIAILESVMVGNGDRYIAYNAERIDVEEVCARIDRLLPELGFANAGHDGGPGRGRLGAEKRAPGGLFRHRPAQ